MGKVGGFCAGCIITYFVFGFAVLEPLTQKKEECERKSNVYECTLTYQPTAQPSWVSNGESK